MFSSMFVIAKIFEELFASTYNGIAVSVWYVSSMPVVLGAIMNDWLQHIQTNQHDGMLRNLKSDTVTEVKHRHGNSVANFKHARVIKSIIYIIMR